MKNEVAQSSEDVKDCELCLSPNKVNKWRSDVSPRKVNLLRAYILLIIRDTLIGLFDI